MKLLVVSNMYPSGKYPTYGVFVKNFCEQLDCINIPYDLSVLRKHDLKISKLFGYIKFYCFTIIKILINRYDVIYVHYASHSGIPALIAGKIKNINLYTNLHGSDVFPENKKQEKMQWVTKKLMNKSKRIIVPSEYFKETVSQKYSITSEKIFVYPSAGVKKEIFHRLDDNEIESEKREYHINNSKITFGIAGRIDVGKGWDTFVDAINLVVRRGFDANFFILGDGKERNDLDKLIQKYSLENKIVRIGLISQEKLAEFYSMLDYFVFPTKREGESLGLVAIEAMACGTPVIASDFAAPKYYVKSGINGYKFSAGNSEELSELMIKLILNNKTGIEELRKEALNTSSNYTTTNTLQVLKGIITTE